MGVSLFMILCILCDCWRRLAGTSSQIWRLDEIGMSFNLFWTCCIKCCPRPNQAMSLFSFLQGTAARSGNCCIFSLISLLAWLQSFQHISHVSMRFNASNLWIGWQVRLPGGELEDALVPCDSAQGVVPLAILASWKYWGCFVLFEFERLKVVCFIKSVCPFLLICNDFCKCRSWNTPHLQSFWS